MNGKLRARVEAAVGRARRPSCSSSPAAPMRVKRQLDGKEVVKEIVVPGKLVNLVVR